ncbi:hypothetical protein OAB63_01950 [Alphaproteobacteria bacterium]|nr:hypothetical protein [Alphaproteobacteria bacterium]
MNKINMGKNENVDILLIIKIIWNDKIIILLFTLVSLVVGYMATKLIKQQYDLKVNYNINMKNHTIAQTCLHKGPFCANILTLGSLIGHLPQHISSSITIPVEQEGLFQIFINGLEKNSEAEISHILNEASIALTEEYKETALLDLSIINKYPNLKTEYFTVFNTYQTLNYIIEGNHKAIDFDYPIETPRPKKIYFIFLLSFLFGPVLGTAIVYFKHYFLNNKKKLL